MSLTLILGNLFLISCHDDNDYSLDNFVVNLATIKQVDDNDNLFYFILDDGTTLYPLEMSTQYKNTNSNQRVFLNYTVLSSTKNGYDKCVRINSISNILTKNMVKQDSITDLGNDPIEVISIWLGDNYINFRFKIQVGGDFKHTVDLVYNPSKILSDTIHLSFKHNAFGDPAKYEEITYAAFSLNALKQTINKNTIIVIENLDFKNQNKEYILKITNTSN